MKKRIAILVPEYKTDQVKRGGLITVADSLIRILSAQQNFEVEVVSPRLWSKAPENHQILQPSTWISGPKTRKASINKVQVTYVGSWFSEIEFFRYKQCKKLKTEIKQFDYIFAVCGNSAFFNLLKGNEGNSLGTFASFTPFERAAMLEDSSGLKKIIKQLVASQISRLDLRSLDLPSQIFVMNKSMNQLALDRGRRDVKYFTPPVSLPSNALLSAKATKSQSEILTLLTVCRLGDPRKNLLELVNIYADLAENSSIKFSAIIAGAGPLDPAVKDHISGKKLNGIIQVVEDPDDQELETLYTNSDLFVLPSKEEGFGMVFLESMRWGVPVITTKTDGANYIFENSDAGILFHIDSHLNENVVKAIHELSLDRQKLLELGNKSRKLVEQRYSDQAVSHLLLSSLEELS